MDGSAIEELPVDNLGYPRAITFDPQQKKIYWTDLFPSRIRRADADGSNVEDIVTEDLQDPDIVTLDKVNRKMYWTDLGSNTIKRANLDGSNIQTVISGLNDPRGIRVYHVNKQAAHRISTPPTIQDQKQDISAMNIEQIPGKLIFQGRYQHRSRGRDIDTPGQLWIKQDSDGVLRVLGNLPWMGSYDLATGANGQLTSYRTGKEGAYHINLEIQDDKALLTRQGVREDCNNKELSILRKAYFNPNTRPDSYCADYIFLRGIDLKPGQKKEFRVYDWDNTGEALVGYSIQISHEGKEQIAVPAGTFEANHYILKQVTSADTWFKKRAGHITDYWLLDNGIIVRVVRHREPYELELLDYTYPENLSY
jgi:hypothetical protein